MLTYLALSGLPEWTTLSKVQRQFVWRHFIHPMLTRWRIRVAKMGLLLLSLAVAWFLGGFSTTTATFVTCFVMILFVTEIFDFFVVERWRQKVKTYIQDHGSELKSAA